MNAVTSEVTQLAARYFTEIQPQVDGFVVSGSRAELAREIKVALNTFLQRDRLSLNLLDHRDLVTLILNRLLGESQTAPNSLQQATDIVAAITAPAATATLQDINKLAIGNGADKHQTLNPMLAQTRAKIQPLVMERVDTSAAAKMSREELGRDLVGLFSEILTEQKIQLNAQERTDIVSQMLDDMLGLGPLEPLLADDKITEIMVNGPNQIYVEKGGRLTLTDVTFRDNQHAQSVATRIVTAIGRRIDESSPLCDARLMDGSRVNIIIPPLAIDGTSITIRKFSKKKITLDVMEGYGSLSPTMRKVLEIAGRCRCNILISGGTGSGKTTLLNAISQMIDPAERIVTIEDAAELQLQQPHVVRLETRPANLEGDGEITMRDLLKNSLRMRPDRIIVGETRGGEAIDMLQAMNTGHDGSFSTVHANRPREALMRLENMVGLAGVNLAPRAIRQLIASAVDMIVQVSRMRDGSRRITHISEVVGMEGEIITMQDLFTSEVKGEDADGKLVVDFHSHGLRPAFCEKAAYYGMERQLLELM